MLLERLLDPLAPPLCAACRRHAGRSGPLCAECRAALRWLGSEPAAVAGVELWAPLAYEGPARAIVAGLKFGGLSGLAATIGAQIAARAPPGVLEQAVLVPVPLHPARLSRRGYNQAALIAAQVAARTGLGIADCLERGGRGTTQVGRGRSERAAAIEGAVTVRARTPLPRDCLIVDDVVTTGATLAACAAALSASRARTVRGLAYARTPGR